MDKKEKSIRKIYRCVEAYKESVKNGKRVTEIISALSSSLRQLDHAINGTYDNPFMGLINFSAGLKKVPIKDQKDLINLDDLKQHMENLLQTCKDIEENDPCKHNWLIEETWYNGGGMMPTPPYIDMHCTECDSSITSYDCIKNYPVWLKYLTPEEAALFPRELKYEERTEGGIAIKMDLRPIVKMVLEHKDEFVEEAETLTSIINKTI